MMRAPVIVLNTNTKREHGRKAQLNNIAAAKAVADIVRTSLGPRAMLKMLLDPMGGVVVTNDGNSILREIDVTHPAAKSMLELSRAQDENVGDGTTSVIILAGEMLHVAEPLLEHSHPQVIVSSYYKALDDALEILRSMAKPIDVNDNAAVLEIVASSVGTKFSASWEGIVAKMALEAVRRVMLTRPDGTKEIDIKRYARVEKIPGGEIEQSKVLDGIILNKDVVHAQMRREIRNPRIILLDGSLEYKKGEAMTDVMLTKEEDFDAILRIEEDAIQEMCAQIIKLKPDLVVTEKGISDLAQHLLMKNNISAIRRVRKTDNNRIARASGATIAHRPDELSEKDVGTGCGLFRIEKIGDEYFTFLVECKDPKAVSIVLRGAGKEFLSEVERNLQDAMAVARNVFLDPFVVPGGGASEMAVACGLVKKAKTMEGVQALPYNQVAAAFEIIPRTLAENCGAPVIRVITELRAKQMQGLSTYGIDGIEGKVADMTKLRIWEPLEVKAQTFKTAMESAALLLRIDDIVSGLSKPQQGGQQQQQAPPEEQAQGEGQ